MSSASAGLRYKLEFRPSIDEHRPAKIMRKNVDHNYMQERDVPYLKTSVDHIKIEFIWISVESLSFQSFQGFLLSLKITKTQNKIEEST